MADPKDDKSTDIETSVKAFVKDINAELVALRKAQLDKQKSAAPPTGKKSSKKLDSVPVVTFSLSPTKVSKSRTPAEQAQLVVKKSTKVCWSSHMADKARHVLMKVDGKVSWDAKKALGDDFEAFKKKWKSVMKTHGLKNAAGQDGWPSWDQFHLELPDSKIDRSDERAQSCLDEYARLTRIDGKPKNNSFESKYNSLLKSFIEKYEKEAEEKKKKAAEQGKQKPK